MPKSEITWSREELEALINDYLWRSGLRPVEKTPDAEKTEEGDSKKAKKKSEGTYKWRFSQRAATLSLRVEVEPDPDFDNSESLVRCHRCGQVIRMSNTLDKKGTSDEYAPSSSLSPPPPSEEPIDIPLDPRFVPKDTIRALQAENAKRAKARKQNSQENKNGRQQQQQQRMPGETKDRPY